MRLSSAKSLVVELGVDRGRSFMYSTVGKEGGLRRCLVGHLKRQGQKEKKSRRGEHVESGQKEKQ